MIDNITNAVSREIAISKAEQDILRLLLAAALTGTRQLKLNMTEERWLRLGVHLVSVIRRTDHGEMLPVVDEAMLGQVDCEMQELSRRVLQAAGSARGYGNDVAEVFLLAVHFAAAKYDN